MVFLKDYVSETGSLSISNLEGPFERANHNTGSSSQTTGWGAKVNEYILKSNIKKTTKTDKVLKVKTNF
jgi:hypothetical protein